MKIEELLNSDSPSPCPDASTLENYISGKLSASEQHAVERHLVDCQFCEEAIEGLRLLNEKLRLTSIQDDLEESLSRRMKPVTEGRVRVLFSWKIAAAFALLIGSMTLLWFFIPREDSNQLFTQEFKPYPAPDPISNAEVQTMETGPVNEELPAENRQKETRSPQHSESKSDPVQSEKSADQDESDASLRAEPSVSSTESEAPASFNVVSQPAQEELDANAGKSLDTKSSKDKTLSKEAAETESATPSLNRVTSVSSKREKQASGTLKTTDITVNADFNSGMAAYQKQDYYLAISYLSKLQEPPDALFYLGLSFLSSDQPEPALQQFKHYLENRNSTRKEAAHWYAALAAIKLGKKREARYFLQKVIAFQGEFEDEATELLKKL